MLRKLLKNRVGTAEIIGTVLFLVILFFFFSNVFLWHNQVTREMDQLIADKTNSAVRIETTALTGTPVTTYTSISRSLGQGGYYDFPFGKGIDKTLIADLRFSIYANFTGDLNQSCFVQILDFNHIPVNTGLMVMNGPLTWSNITLSLPSSYIDGDGTVTIRIVDASSQSGRLTLNISYMAVCADPVALEVTNLGGTDATLSRLWIINATDHVYADFEAVPNGTLVAGGSRRTIMFSAETTFTDGEDSILATADGNNIVVHYVPPAGQTTTFRVLTTLGNTAACSYTFP
jgi:hypothetical protein